MYIFFLIINIIYSLIFYLFFQTFESIIFIVFGLILFFYFSPFYFWKKDEDKPKFIPKISLNKEKIINIIIPSIQKISYFLAFCLFYISLYWISYSFSWNLFSIFTLVISLFLTWLFFYYKNEDKNIIFLLFRSNFLVFSILYFILFMVYYFDFSKIDIIFFVNSSLSLFWLISIIIFDKKYPLFKKTIIYSYTLLYIIVFSLFYTSFLFKIQPTLLFLYIWMIYSIVYFEYFPKIKLFKNFNVTSKLFWTILNYIVLILAIIMFLWFGSKDVIFIFLIWIIFNVYIHSMFENYISYFITLLMISILYIKFLWFDYKNFIWVILFTFIMPFVFIFYSYLVRLKFIYDNYLLHYFWIIFSLITIIYYLIISKDFDILHISILFLLESILFFTSFIKLKKI